MDMFLLGAIFGIVLVVIVVLWLFAVQELLKFMSAREQENRKRVLKGYNPQ